VTPIHVDCFDKGVNSVDTHVLIFQDGSGGSSCFYSNDYFAWNRG